MEGKQLVGAAEGAESGESEICFRCHHVTEYLLCCGGSPGPCAPGEQLQHLPACEG